MSLNVTVKDKKEKNLKLKMMQGWMKKLQKSCRRITMLNNRNILR